MFIKRIIHYGTPQSRPATSSLLKNPSWNLTQMLLKDYSVICLKLNKAVSCQSSSDLRERGRWTIKQITRKRKGAGFRNWSHHKDQNMVTKTGSEAVARILRRMWRKEGKGTSYGASCLESRSPSVFIRARTSIHQSDSLSFLSTSMTLPELLQKPRAVTATVRPRTVKCSSDWASPSWGSFILSLSVWD